MPGMLLAGSCRAMSLMDNQTRELWQEFMPLRNHIPGRVGNELYSVDIYPDAEYLRDFDPHRTFRKWAGVPVTTWEGLPEPLEKLELPEGLYAVFRYRGSPRTVGAFYHRILTEWLPASLYDLEHRPHLAVMGPTYLGDHPDSEEDLWIPVRVKDGAS
ncbi:GyrI-like domain-containing protein [Robiginitalea sp. SC105]|nr:GyrI-like domain-containing protein [Robiginitalea sp. SC105]